MSIRTFDKYLWAQNKICSPVFEELFGDLYTHILDKWLRCGGNFLNFMSLLDDVNKQIVLNWIERSFDLC